MPPKTAATASKDEGSKRLKDLELLLVCVKSNTNAIEIDYEEFMKYDDAPTRPAAQKRVERMSKALGVAVKAVPKKATPKKNMAGKKKKATESSDEEDEASQSPVKKQKLEVGGEHVKNGAEE